MRQIYLRAENLGCDRAGAAIVRGVDLSLGPGEALQLFGANGSGKTSLLNVLAGHLRVAEGRLEWREDDGAWHDAAPAESLFYLGYQPPLRSALTAAENLSFWAAGYGLAGAARDKAVHEALSRFGLKRQINMRAGKLSAGQARRVDLARTALCNRPVWLLDEPAAALDADGAAQVGAVISAHLEAGGLAIIATHDTLSFPAKRMVIG